MSLGTHGHGSARRIGMRTLNLRGTRAAIPFRELDLNHRGPMFIRGRCPELTEFAGRTNGVLLFSINLKVRGGKAGTALAGLPSRIVPGRSHQVHSILFLTGDQEFRIKICRFHQVVVGK